MPKKISTKCNVFLQLIILRPSASVFYPSRSQKNPQNHLHFTRLKIRRSADPHFTGGLICSPQLCQPSVSAVKISIDSVGRPTMSVFISVTVSHRRLSSGVGLVMLNKFEFITSSTNKSFDSSMNSKCGATAHCSVLFTET